MQLYDVFTPERSLKEFQTVFVENSSFLSDADSFVMIYRYFVFNYAGFNLSRAIQTHQSFAEDHIKLIIYSILRGVKVRTFDTTRCLSERYFFPHCLVYALGRRYSPCECCALVVSFVRYCVFF